MLKHRFIYLLLSLLLSPAQAAPTDDGPYVDFSGQGLSARWRCAGETITRHVERLPATLPPVCGHAKTLSIPGPAPADTQAELPAPERLAVLSDIHGQFGTFTRLLQAHGIVDATLDWAYGRGELVVVGDIFDRGPEVTESLWLLYSLEQQARAAGGRVHVLLGNHEFMALGGDLRYVHPRYLESAKALGRSYPALFGADSVLGQWLRQKPVLRRLGDALYLHGGISPAVAELKLDIAKLNAKLMPTLGQSKEQLRAEPLLALLAGREGPLWYRGYFETPGLSAARLDALTQAFGAKRIVVGHTSQERVLALHGGAVLAVDSSIKDGEHGELLLMENGRMERGLQDGRRLPLEPTTGATAPASP
ncbi:MAG: metallophosphoesterase [Gammaproteobacteria bacterium]|nr:metallophosphoesterase [Gammaproteobacteria bacterium]